MSESRLHKSYLNARVNVFFYLVTLFISFFSPNHLTGQFASEALKLYPNANILVTTQRDFEKSNRKRFCMKQI